MTFGALIKQKRLFKGWTQTELANKVYSTTSAISQFESNKHLPKTDMIYSLAEALEIPVELLLFSGKDVILETQLPDSFLTSDMTKSIFGHAPEKISLTDVAEHKYRSLKVWNPDYTVMQFLEDIIYPYVRNHPDTIGNLLVAYGQIEENDDRHFVSIEANAEKTNVSNELILSKTIRKNINVGKNNTLLLSSQNRNIHGNFIKPNLRNLDADFVIVDTCGALYSEMGESLKANGYTVKLLDVSGHSPIDSSDVIFVNPFSCGDIESLVNVIMSYADCDKRGSVYEKSMYNYLHHALTHMSDSHKTKSIDALINIIHDISTGTIPYSLLDTVTEDVRIGTLALLQWFRSYIKSDSQNSDFYDAISEDKYALFLYLDPMNSNNNIMLGHVLESIMSFENVVKYPNRKTLYVLDEFDNLPNIPNLDKHMALSSFKIFMCVTHSISNLTAKYDSQQLETMFGMLNNIVYTNCYDFATTDYMCRKFGDGVTKDRGDMRRSIMNYDELHRLRPDECAVMCNGSQSTLDKLYWSGDDE